MSFKGVPCLVPPALHVHRRKDDRKRKWTREQRTVSSRADDLALLRGNVTLTECLDDHLAHYNVQINVPDYTEEEYDVKLTDTSWTREETAYLLALCQRFDARFAIIHDRYDYPSSERTLEALQKRYYDVVGKLNPAAHFDYPVAQETKRRKQLGEFYDRPKAELELALAQRIQLDRLKASSSLDLARREHQLRLHNAGECAFYAAFPKEGEIESILQDARPSSRNPLAPVSLASSSSSLTSLSSSVDGTPLSPFPQNKKERQRSASVSHATFSHVETPLLTAPFFEAGAASSPFFGLPTFVQTPSFSTASSAALLSQSQPASTTPGVYLRSQRLLSSISTRITHEQKVQLEREMVHGLAIPGIPYMSTEAICQAYGTLRQSLLELIILYDETQNGKRAVLNNT